MRQIALLKARPSIQSILVDGSTEKGSDNMTRFARKIASTVKFCRRVWSDSLPTALAPAVLGATVAVALLGGPTRATAGQDPGPREMQVLSCREVAGDLSPRDCAHFNALSQKVDHAAEMSLRALEFLEDQQVEIAKSSAYRIATLNGLGSLDHLRMQAELDRQSKILETLSNLIKHLAEDADTLVDNLK